MSLQDYLQKDLQSVSDIGYIYRGYEQFEQKLKQLGGEISWLTMKKKLQSLS